MYGVPGIVRFVSPWPVLRSQEIASGGTENAPFPGAYGVLSAIRGLRVNLQNGHLGPSVVSRSDPGESQEDTTRGWGSTPAYA